MILGNVLAGGEAMVKVKVRGPSGPANVETMVDTGFNDEMTLPPWAIEKLGLPCITASTYTLVDGATSTARIFAGEIEWHGTWREVYIVEVDSDPLLGMGLMRDCKLSIEVVDGGAVEIQPLPAESREP